MVAKYSKKEGGPMIMFVYDVIFGYIALFFLRITTVLNLGSRKGQFFVKYNAYLREIYVKYWHPVSIEPICI